MSNFFIYQPQISDLINCSLMDSGEKLETLIKNSNIDVNAPFFYPEYYDRAPEFLIINAARSRNYWAIKSLLNLGADVNIKDSMQRSALIVSCGKGIQERTIRLLIAHGADVNAVDAHGDSALFYSVEDAMMTQIKLLLDAGAEITQDCLDRAYRNYYDNPIYSFVYKEICELLESRLKERGRTL